MTMPLLEQHQRRLDALHARAEKLKETIDNEGAPAVRRELETELRIVSGVANKVHVAVSQWRAAAARLEPLKELVKALETAGERIGQAERDMARGDYRSLGIAAVEYELRGKLQYARKLAKRLQDEVDKYRGDLEALEDPEAKAA